MCVLTYIPLNSGFILTSNRDEAVLRSAALPPRKYQVEGESVFFPKDPQSGGTWIATNKRFTLCLLNGAKEKHQANPPYRHSRGKVIQDFFGFKNILNFKEKYNFIDLEPFTLVMIDAFDKDSLHQIRWDSFAVSYETFSRDEPKIWSSSTLYSADVIAYRELCFEVFLRDEVAKPESLLAFHHFGGGTDIENKLLMNRNDTLKTLSVTQIVHTPENYTMNYEDLAKNKIYRYRILQERELVG